ncbi:LCCL domain-containing protein [Mycena venus]|uniref:LCCL domain-containing protein n=1 Tax=Mycena venus TaxID=2733690 RepID=A0A8H6YWS1_9AGAR|nr:LCCL domain-containing protein [Mycena venus]
MAVPATFTSADFSGKFTQNSSLSDSMDTILEHQGVGWVKRKAIHAISVALSLRHYKDSAGVEHIEVSRTIKGSSSEKAEERILDWKDTRNNDGMLGPVTGRARRIQVSELEVNYLKQGWTTDTVQHGVVQMYTHSDKPWTAIQCWGVEEIKGERRYTRRVKFTGPKGQEVEARMVYDYLGPL